MESNQGKLRFQALPARCVSSLSMYNPSCFAEQVGTSHRRGYLKVEPSIGAWGTRSANLGSSHRPPGPALPVAERQVLRQERIMNYGVWGMNGEILNIGAGRANRQLTCPD
jgi:hypothetical protein